MQTLFPKESLHVKNCFLKFINIFIKYLYVAIFWKMVAATARMAGFVDGSTGHDYGGFVS
jgi:hypothetical protein